VRGDANGLRLHPSRVIVRNLLRAVDLLPGLNKVGGACCCFSVRRRGLGDFTAETIVVRTNEVTSPDVSRLETPKHNSLAEDRPLAARLRSEVPAAAVYISPVDRRPLRIRDHMSGTRVQACHRLRRSDQR